jgi:DNA-binding LacI/PurR family transcriptional regulator
MNTSMETGIKADSMYLVLASTMRQAIADQTYRPGDMIASEHELARREKVSRVTVRRASDVLIQEGLVERRPGKGLFVRAQDILPRTLTIQVVAGNLAWEPCLQAARGVQAAAREQRAVVQLHDAHGNEAEDIELIKQLPDSGAHGAVIVSLHSAAFVEALYGLKVRGFPFVLVDQRLRDLEVPSVMADNHSGGLAIGQHLLGLGHRRVAFIGDLVADTVQARLLGLRDAFGDAGLPFDRSLVVDLKPTSRLDDWTPQVIAQALPLLTREDRPTAIFASCDAVARGVYHAARERGLELPRDLSIAGFDDDPLAALLTPALTTVRQPFTEMGRAAFSLLHATIRNRQATVEHRQLPVQPMYRASTAAPLGAA